MAKSNSGFDPSIYAPVAERVRLFWASFPGGRITTRLVSRTEREVIFEARIYRSATETEPAATGWAAEREGDGDVNAVACLENTETSAVGRALANFGFTAAKERPSIEEMQQVMRARTRLARHRVCEPPQVHRARITAAEALDVYRLDAPARQSYTNIVSDLVELVDRAERQGLRARRAQRWRDMLADVLASRQVPTECLLICERRLRAWLANSADVPWTSRPRTNNMRAP